LLPLIVVRILDKHRVGLYREVFQVITNLAGILPLGLSSSAYYFLARDETKKKSAVLNILIFNFAMGAIGFAILFLLPQILSAIFRNEELVTFSPKVGIAVWLWILGAFLETVALANRETKLAMRLIIGSQLSKTVLMVGALLIFASVESLVYAAIIQTALQTAALLLYLNSRFPGYWRSFDAAFFREHLRYALPFGFAGLLWTLQTDIHNYFVGYRFSEEEYAIYAYGCFQIPFIAMLSESVTAVLIPRMSELQSHGKTREMLELTARAAQKLAFFFFPIYAFLLINAYVLITTLFTKNFEESVPIFIVNLTLIPFYIVVVDPLTRAFKELGRILLGFRIIVFFGLITALWIGIRSFSLRGMVAIVVVASIFESFFLTGTIVKRIGVDRSDIGLLAGVGKTALATIISALGFYAIYYFVEEIAFRACISISGILFSGFFAGRLVGFFGGSLFLFVSFMLFAAIYLSIANYFGLIEDSEKARVARVKEKMRRFLRRESESR
jgi:O-antigen/teichoic acid export membrane protein